VEKPEGLAASWVEILVKSILGQETARSSAGLNIAVGMIIL
jgi:hypothetical protein